MKLRWVAWRDVKPVVGGAAGAGWTVARVATAGDSREAPREAPQAMPGHDGLDDLAAARQAAARPRAGTLPGPAAPASVLRRGVSEPVLRALGVGGAGRSLAARRRPAAESLPNLHAAAARGDADQLMTLFAEPGSAAALFEQDAAGLTPLEAALAADQDVAVQFLVGRMTKLDTPRDQAEAVLRRALLSALQRGGRVLSDIRAALADALVTVAMLRQQHDMTAIVRVARIDDRPTAEVIRGELESRLFGDPAGELQRRARADLHVSACVERTTRDFRLVAICDTLRRLANVGDADARCEQLRALVGRDADGTHLLAEARQEAADAMASPTAAPEVLAECVALHAVLAGIVPDAGAGRGMAAALDLCDGRLDRLATGR